MQIIYALIAACLSLQACNSAAPAPDIGITADQLVITSFEDDAAIVAAAPVAPIDGAEFEGTSRDSSQAAWTTIHDDDFGYTATVIAPKPIETDLGFHIDEDGEIVYHIAPPVLETPPLP